MAEETKLVIIKDGGPIRSLGGISGPILSPTRITIPVIVDLINQGKHVFEVNPLDKKQAVQLNRLNVYRTNFKPRLLKKPSKDVSVAQKKEEISTTVRAEDVNLPSIIAEHVPPEYAIDPDTGESPVRMDIFQNNNNDNQSHKKKHRH